MYNKQSKTPICFKEQQSPLIEFLDKHQDDSPGSLRISPPSSVNSPFMRNKHKHNFMAPGLITCAHFPAPPKGCLVAICQQLKYGLTQNHSLYFITQLLCRVSLMIKVAFIRPDEQTLWRTCCVSLSHI